MFDSVECFLMKESLHGISIAIHQRQRKEIFEILVNLKNF